MLIVQKYGGATLADPAKIKIAAERICSLVKANHKVVAIVSAMGQTTNQLMELAQKISPQPNRRELDMLLSTGERVSMALLSMALHDHGCDAISFTGSQAGIFTNESHVNAFITDVRAFRVSESLAAGKVVVQAGFQGVSPATKEITTLGRGGTDTTAMAMAIYLKADRCEILKEVPAVFTADPNLVPQARPLKKLSYQQLAHMCFWGAKVLHFRSAELACRNEIPLYIGPASDADAEGTWVSKEGDPMYESAKILSLNSHERVFVLEGSFANGNEAFTTLGKFIEKAQLAWPQILQTSASGGKIAFCLTGPSEQMDALEKFVGQEPRFSLKKGLASVTASCTGASSPELSEKILQILGQEKIPFQELKMNSMGFTIFLSENDRKRALTSLHHLTVV